MDNAHWIVVAIIAALVKESVSALVRFIAKHAPTVRRKAASVLTTHWRRIDAGLDFIQALFQGWFAWRVSIGPDRPGQMFVVAFLMAVASLYFQLGTEKMWRDKSG